VTETFALSDLEDNLRHVLLDLAAAPRAHRPYVIVQDSVTGRFVQMATCSKCEEFIFDVPGKADFPKTENCIIGSISRHAKSIDELLLWSRSTLSGPLRLPPEATLEIRFETTEAGKDG